MAMASVEFQERAPDQHLYFIFGSYDRPFLLDNSLLTVWSPSHSFEAASLSRPNLGLRWQGSRA